MLQIAWYCSVGKKGGRQNEEYYHLKRVCDVMPT